MKTAEEFYNEIKGNYTIIELMEMYALEVAKETQRRCAENAVVLTTNIKTKNELEVRQWTTHDGIKFSASKQSILDPKNLAI